MKLLHNRPTRMGMMWILQANSLGMQACSTVMSAYVKHLPIERLGGAFCFEKGGCARVVSGCLQENDDS